MGLYRNRRYTQKRRAATMYKVRGYKRARVKRRYTRRLTNTLYRQSKVYRNPFTANTSRCMLIYNTPMTINPAAGNIGGGLHVFSANSAYDPDVTGVGHQPMYFDNYAALYSKYRVNYAKMTVTVINHSVNTAVWNGTSVTSQPNYSYKLFILKDNQTNDYPANINQIIEEGGANISWRFIGPSMTGKLPKLYSFCSPHKLNSVPFKEETLSAEVTSSPITKAMFIVGAASADGVTDPPAFSVNVKIQYWMEFFDRKLLQSEQ